MASGAVACNGPLTGDPDSSNGTARSATGPSVAASAWHHRYALTDLGTGLPGAPGLVPEDVNDRGVVVGMASYPILSSLSSCAPDCGTAQGWIYKGGSLTMLPPLNSDVQSVVDAVNIDGVVSGGSVGSVVETAVLWNPDGSITSLGTGIDGPGGSAEATDISDNGNIVGASIDVTGSVLTPTQFHLKAPPTAPCGTGVDGYFTAVNNSGLGAGLELPSTGGEAAITCAPFAVIESNPGFVDFASDINDEGDVVGRRVIGPTRFNFHAFLYRHGTTTDLGTLFPGDASSVSAAFGVNNRGQIVGFTASENAIPLPPVNPRAYIYDEGQMIDLNTLIPDDKRATWTLVLAFRISNSGNIVGEAWVGGYPNGIEHGFLLTPQE